MDPWATSKLTITPSEVEDHEPLKYDMPLGARSPHASSGLRRATRCEERSRAPVSKSLEHGPWPMPRGPHERTALRGVHPLKPTAGPPVRKTGLRSASRASKLRRKRSPRHAGPRTGLSARNPLACPKVSRPLPWGSTQ